MSLQRRVRIARGDEPADLVLRNAQLVNVCSGEIYRTDVVVADGLVVTLGEGYEGKEERDLGGRYLVPGLIDGHMHLESSMMVTGEFARVVVPHGTTTIMIDPHEFANVLGIEGLRYIIRSARNVPLNVNIMLSPCVPVSPLESPWETLLAADLMPLLDDPQVRGLAEVSDIAAVLRGDPQVLDKIEVVRARGRVVDGHAPGMRGRELRTYVAAGVQSDHESTSVEEAREKLRLGLAFMIREGSVARNLDALVPLIKELHPPRAFFVTDDNDPVDLINYGHIDAIVRKALGHGLDPVEVIRMASFNAAQYFRLYDCGAVAPGYRADMVVVSDLPSFTIDQVYKDGVLVAEHGEPLFTVPTPTPEELAGVVDTINIAPVTPEQLRLPGRTGPALVIGLIKDQIITEQLTEYVEAPDGYIRTDPTRDILKMVVVERHHRTGRIGLGLVKGFGLRKGALASSVAHDAHNLVVAGVSDTDILKSIEVVKEIGGGFVVVADGEVLATLPLPMAGLVSPLPLKEVFARLNALDRAAASLGCTLAHPFMTLSFLSLSVIPKLKLTDHGLVDAENVELVAMQA